MALKDKKKGDKVYMDCYSSMGASSAGNLVVKNVTVKYDEDTGKPYNAIHTSGEVWDSRTGDSITNKSSMYYIS